MKIPVGKYRLASDTNCIILQERKARKEGNNKGEEYFDNLGYYSTVTAAAKAIIDHNVRASEATSLKELMAEIAEVKAMIQKALKGV